PPLAKTRLVRCMSWITEVGSLNYPLLTRHRSGRALCLQFVSDPVNHHPRPLRDSARRIFDRPGIGKKIERIKPAPAFFRTVLHLKIAGDWGDAEALFAKQRDGSREMAGGADQED